MKWDYFFSILMVGGVLTYDLTLLCIVYWESLLNLLGSVGSTYKFDKLLHLAFNRPAV